MLELLTEMVREYRSSADKNATESLVDIINKAYVATLKRHHGFVSKQLFKVNFVTILLITFVLLKLPLPCTFSMI